MLATIILLVISSIFEAIMDIVAHKYDRSIFKNILPKLEVWKNPKMSWENKWKFGKPEHGERFWGSSTIFVFLTDLWHFVKMFRIITLILAIVFYVPLFGIIYDFLLFFIIRSFIFEVFYGLFETKND